MANSWNPSLGNRQGKGTASRSRLAPLLATASKTSLEGNSWNLALASTDGKRCRLSISTCSAVGNSKQARLEEQFSESTYQGRKPTPQHTIINKKRKRAMFQSAFFLLSLICVNSYIRWVSNDVITWDHPGQKGALAKPYR
jgi:hypothetical protein